VTASLGFAPTPAQRYVLRVADTCLIHAQRLLEWCGHGPVIEEDIALANMALDLLGQARALLTHVGAAEGQDEDALAFLRDEDQFLNLTLVELPLRRPGDFADTVLRNFLLSSWLHALWSRLQASTDAGLAAIAAKAVKEARYHVRHTGQWVITLGDGTTESHDRVQSAVTELWRYTGELFLQDDVERDAAAQGYGVDASTLADAWRTQVEDVLRRATLTVPPVSYMQRGGRDGRHTEHLGHMLSEMQIVARSHPGASW